MKKFFFILVSTFIALFVINLTWIIANLFFWSISGIDVVLSEKSLFEDIYFSTYFIWIIWADVAWWIMLLFFAKQRKRYKSDSGHYLIHNPLYLFAFLICMVLCYSVHAAFHFAM